MKKLLLACLIIFSEFVIAGTSTISYAQHKPIPPYAKWGKIAMEKTKEKYPNAQIIDYLHISRFQGADISMEKFKLWLKEGTREFGVFIDIEFDNKTEKVLKITFRESAK